MVQFSEEPVYFPGCLNKKKHQLILKIAKENTAEFPSV